MARDQTDLGLSFDSWSPHQVPKNQNWQFGLRNVPFFEPIGFFREDMTWPLHSVVSKTLAFRYYRISRSNSCNSYPYDHDLILKKNLKAFYIFHYTIFMHVLTLHLLWSLLQFISIWFIYEQPPTLYQIHSLTLKLLSIQCILYSTYILEPVRNLNFKSLM